MNSLNSVKHEVTSTKLINILKKHRDESAKDYERALKVYMSNLQGGLDNVLAMVLDGKIPDIPENMGYTKPIDNSKIYNKRISAFEMDCHMNIEISNSDLEKIISDDWSPEIIASKRINSSYLS